MVRGSDLFTGVAHVCIVTADVDRLVRVFSDRYGVGPWRVYVYDRSNMTVDVDGEASDFTMRVALGSIGNCGIALIQPNSGTTTGYWDIDNVRLTASLPDVWMR